MTESEALLFGLQAATQFPVEFAAAMATARYHRVVHVRTNPKHGREESVVVGRIVLVGDETPAEVAARLASKGWSPTCHRIALDGELVVTP